MGQRVGQADQQAEAVEEPLQLVARRGQHRVHRLVQHVDGRVRRTPRRAPRTAPRPGTACRARTRWRARRRTGRRRCPARRRRGRSGPGRPPRPARRAGGRPPPRGSSTSTPCTVIPGYVSASPIAAQPSPQPTSSTRAPPVSFACSSGTCGTQLAGSACRSAGALPSPCGPGHLRPVRRPGRHRRPPARSGRSPAAAGRRPASSAPAARSTADCPGPAARSRARPAARTGAVGDSRMPATACCSSHSRV